jgi:hypothetical protein
LINFRYHVVSLVAVFLALAVGIVLGAGPLEGPISSALSDQVSSLRNEKDALRTELESTNAQWSYAQEAFGALSDQALGGLLNDRSVAVVTIGSSLDDRTAVLTAGLQAAGGTLAALVHVEDRWANGPADRRTALAEQASGLLGISLEDTSENAVLSAALARALAGTVDQVDGGTSGTQPGGDPGSDTGGPGGDTGSSSSASPGAGPSPNPGSSSNPSPGVTNGQGGTDGQANQGSDTPDPEAGIELTLDGLPRELWELLETANYISGHTDTPAEAVIVLTGPYHLKPELIDDQDLSGARSEVYSGLVVAFAEAPLATVVAGPSQVETDLVSRVSGTGAMSSRVSSVAIPFEQAEAIAALWTTAAAIKGETGHYGMSQGASIFPDYSPPQSATAPPAGEEP